MSSATINPAVLAAAILSILLEWLPKLSDWWHALTPARRAGINALLVALISVVAVVGNCYLWGDVCPANVWDAVGDILIVALLAAAGNQAVHAMTRRELAA